MKKWNGGRLNFPKTSRKWKSGIQRMKKMEKWNTNNKKNGMAREKPFHFFIMACGRIPFFMPFLFGKYVLFCYSANF